jgi:hypothetical protein
MYWRNPPGFVSVAFLLAITAAGPAAGKDSLVVAADAPLVALVPRDPGRHFVRLPTLEYKFEIRTHCSDGRSAESLSLSVADTRKSLPAREIISDGPTEIRLRIPASQIAPIVIEDFCIVQLAEDGDRTGEAPTQIVFPAALSAQASLLCAGDEDKAMTYASRTLDVSLVCEPVANGEARQEQ